MLGYVRVLHKIYVYPCNINHDNLNMEIVLKNIYTVPSFIIKHNSHNREKLLCERGGGLAALTKACSDLYVCSDRWCFSKTMSFFTNKNIKLTPHGTIAHIPTNLIFQMKNLMPMQEVNEPENNNMNSIIFYWCESWWEKNLISNWWRGSRRRRRRWIYWVRENVTASYVHIVILSTSKTK